MFNINEVVGYIIRSDHAVNMADMQDSDLTHLKLQKLLYYSQGHSLGELGKPLFAEIFIAWQHGPVITEIYHDFKPNGSDLIGFDIGDQEKYDCNNLLKDKKSLELIDRTINYYNQYSPWKLRNMTHEEEPWKNVNIHSIISNQSLKDFFSRSDIKSRIQCSASM
jgi:uncharacterized phage-associated protein